MTPLIAAALIVKDPEPEAFKRALGSIAEHVDGVFIYDTGSADVDAVEALADEALVEVDSAVPCEVKRGEWRGNFSWAREQSFAMIPDDYDWVLWLDDDDEIVGAENLRAMAASAPPPLDGYVVFYDYARDGENTNVCELWRERLIRRDAGYTWHGAVHEVLIPPDGRPPRFQSVPREVLRYVHHRPGERYGDERNLDILRADYQASLDAGTPPDPRTLAYLGTEYAAKGRFTDAIPFYEEYLARQDTSWPDERAQIYHKLATALRLSGHPHASIEVEFRALRERDDWSEQAVGIMEGFAAIGEWDRVETWAKRALELGKPETLLILNPLEFAFLPMLRLSEVALNRGRFDEANAWLDRAGQQWPSNEHVNEKRASYAEAQKQGETVKALLYLRDTLARHDESLKALQLIEAAPYFVHDHPAVVAARAEQRTVVRHATDPDAYREWYGGKHEPYQTPDEHLPDLEHRLHRAGALLECVREQAAERGVDPAELRVLDLGCNDFVIGAYLARNGIPNVVGVDLNAENVAHAKDRIRRLGLDSCFAIQADLHDVPDQIEGQFDAVALFEVIEHVPDMDATLRACEAMLAPGGVVYVSTPNGSFDRGEGAGSAHMPVREHLRAIPIDELARMLAARGEVTALAEQHMGRVAFAGYRPRRKKGRVVFHGGHSVEQWSPASVKVGGIGGSETALVHVTTRLAQAGYHVEVFADAEPGLYAGAVWRPKTAWDPSEHADATIISRLPAAFDFPINSPIRALWCHDQLYSDVTPERGERMTHVITLSDWQTGWSQKAYPVDPAKFVQCRNGIAGIPESVPGYADRKPRVVYSSAPDRGLAILLGLWPKIRAVVPGVELHAFYGFDTFDKVAAWNPALRDYKADLLAKIDELGGEEGGVFLRGRVGQEELMHEFQTARVLGYPANFRETSCITAMEARAAGLPIVTSRLAALAETVGKHGILLDVPGDDNTPGMNADESVFDGSYGAAFVYHVTRLLSSETYWTKWSKRARVDAETLTWDARMGDWLALLESGVREKVAA